MQDFRIGNLVLISMAGVIAGVWRNDDYDRIKYRVDFSEGFKELGRAFVTERSLIPSNFRLMGELMSDEQVYRIGDSVLVFQVGRVVAAEEDEDTGAIEYKIKFEDFHKNEIGTAFVQSEALIHSGNSLEK